MATTRQQLHHLHHYVHCQLHGVWNFLEVSVLHFPWKARKASRPAKATTYTLSLSSLLYWVWHLDQVTWQILNNDTVLSLFTWATVPLSTHSTFTRLLLPFLCRIQQKSLEQVWEVHFQHIQCILLNDFRLCSYSGHQNMYIFSSLKSLHLAFSFALHFDVHLCLNEITKQQPR